MAKNTHTRATGEGETERETPHRLRVLPTNQYHPQDVNLLSDAAMPSGDSLPSETRARSDFVPSNSAIRVTFVTQSFPPETHAGANRAIAMASALSEACELTVVAPMPSYPTPDHFAGATVEAHDQQFPFQIKRGSPFRPHTSGYLRRGMREAILALSLAAKVDRTTDIVVATTPSFFLAPVGMLAARMGRKRFYWDIRDLTWEYALEALQDLPERQRLRRKASWLMRAVARRVAKQSDGIVASNTGIAEYFTSAFGCENVHVGRNGVSQAIYTDLGSIRDRSTTGEPFTVTYVGALGYFQAVETLLDAAEKLSDAEFRVVGDGPERPRLEQAVIDRDLGNVTFTGFLKRDQVYAEYGRADVLFAQLRGVDVIASSTVPSKVYEYLATGKPIVYGGTGITADFLAETGAAKVVMPQNMVELVDALNDLRDNPNLRLRMGEAGRANASTRIREDIMNEVSRQILSQEGGFGSVDATRQQEALAASHIDHDE